MNDLDKIAAKIRALLEKTVENGCTEEEAISAAKKAAEMLARYNLSVDEVQMRASPFSKHTECHEDEIGARLWKVASAISYMTGARYWTSPIAVHPVEINFFGFDHEVLVARYLIDICARALRTEKARLEKRFALLVPPHRCRRLAPFIDGMVDRLAVRIRELKPPEPAGTGIVVLHKSLIDAAMDAAGIRTRGVRARRSNDFDPLYGEGCAAADKVALNAGIAGRGAVTGLLVR